MAKTEAFTTPPLIRNVRRNGNSAGILIPASILKEMGLEVGGQVELKMRGVDLMISPVKTGLATDEEFDTAAKHVLKKYHGANAKLSKR